jgi:hypothetical protein
MKDLLKRLISRNETGRKWILAHRLRTYLEEVGWYRSVEGRLPVDQQGNCIPWFTYAAIAFLQKKVPQGLTVFEYGSGNSTLWWAQRATSVTTFEHDLTWFNTFKQRVPVNVAYHHCALEYGGEYSKVISNYQDQFDVIVIDGRDRVNCAKNAVLALKEDGVIIFDNTERARYQAGYTWLLEQGFKVLDFEGLRPINCDGAWTSVFYRPNNCLGI